MRLSIKGAVQGVEGQTPGGSVKLEPHASGELRVHLKNMPWALDAPLELAGMRGFAVHRIVASSEDAEQKILTAATMYPRRFQRR